MSTKIVQTSEFVTLVGAGPVNTSNLNEALKIAPTLIAADGGAEMLRKYGNSPEIVIGDMDSASAQTLALLNDQIVHKIVDQDTTDFEKALGAISAPLVLGLGFLGGRVDHQLSAMRAVAQTPEHRCILLGDEDIVFRLPEHLDMPLPSGTRVSIFPFAQARVQAAGLKWPLDDVALSMASFISQSNEVTRDRLEIHAMGQAVIVLPIQALSESVAALTRSRQMT